MSAREGKVNVNASYVWSIIADKDFEKQGYSADKRIPIDPDNKDHELDCADFLVALLAAIYPNLDRLSHWDYSWTKEERKVFGIDDGYGVNYDRHFVLDGKEYFLEVDRGTKNPEYVYDQLRRYKKFFTDVTPGARLLVTAQKYRFKTDNDRAAQIWNMLKRLDDSVPKRMMVTVHALALVDPVAAIWKCPPDAEPVYRLDEP